MSFTLNGTPNAVKNQPKIKGGAATITNQEIIVINRENTKNQSLLKELLCFNNFSLKVKSSNLLALTEIQNKYFI